MKSPARTYCTSVEVTSTAVTYTDTIYQQNDPKIHKSRLIIRAGNTNSGNTINFLEILINIILILRYRILRVKAFQETSTSMQLN